MNFRMEQSSIPITTETCDNCGEGMLLCPDCNMYVHWFFAGIRLEGGSYQEQDFYRPFCGCLDPITAAPRFVSMFTNEDYAKDPLLVISEHQDYKVTVEAGDPIGAIYIEPSTYGSLPPWEEEG